MRTTIESKAVIAILPGSTRGSHAGCGGSPQQSFPLRGFTPEKAINRSAADKFAMAGRHRPHASRVRSPDHSTRRRRSAASLP
jgi:hypothetical protein